MSEKLRKLISLMILLAVCLAPAKLHAESYDYHVTVYAGEHGTLTYNETEEGLNVKELEFKAGERFNPNDFTVEVDDDKYYFKGFHVSGIEGRIEGSLKVNEDIILVATYGIKGKQVAYYISYVDKTTGARLLPTRTEHGNPGDEAVAAYRYIEGYVPDFYNAHLILSEDESKNKIVFEYTPLVNNVTVDIIDQGGGGGGGDGGTGGGNGGAGGGTSPSQESEQSEPIESIDIVDPENPAAGPETEPSVPEVPQENQGHSFSWLWTILAALGFSLLLILLIILLLKRKRDREN